jgi:hypothetical protein
MAGSALLQAVTCQREQEGDAEAWHEACKRNRARDHQEEQEHPLRDLQGQPLSSCSSSPLLTFIKCFLVLFMVVPEPHS